MASGALPKGHERPSGSSPQNTSQTKKGRADKMGISIAIGITAAALIIGIGFAGVLPIGEELSSLMPPSTTTPVAQQAPSYGSYATSDRDLIDQLDWSISTGDVIAMYLD